MRLSDAVRDYPGATWLLGYRARLCGLITILECVSGCVLSERLLVICGGVRRME